VIQSQLAKQAQFGETLRNGAAEIVVGEDQLLQATDVPQLLCEPQLRRG
jgi:hypothetical protein